MLKPNWFGNEPQIVIVNNDGAMSVNIHKLLVMNVKLTPIRQIYVFFVNLYRVVIYDMFELE